MADAAFDLQGCSTVELRDQVARAKATFHRLKGELAARTETTPYPSRLPPSLVLEFLPFRDLAAALRVSTTWRDQAEETFRRIAARLSLTQWPRLTTTMWRDVIKSHVSLRWIRVLDNDFEQSNELTEALINRSDWPHNFVTANGVDLYAIGRGTALHVENDDVKNLIDWDVQMSRPEEHYIDACGVAVTDHKGRVRKTFIWNSDGDTYDGSGPEGMETEFITSTSEDYLFGPAATTLRVVVTRRGWDFRFSLLVPDKNGSGNWTRLSSLHGCDWELEDATLFPQGVFVAPLVRVFSGSAKLLRLAPAARSYAHEDF
jgi:hypothetical protein